MHEDTLFARIREAHVRIRPQVRVTPLDRSIGLSTEIGADVWLKADHLQPTGSFKLRGATNKIRELGESARVSGVITASTGNHGQAAAYAGLQAGVAVTVYVGEATLPMKIAAMQAMSARVVTVPGSPLVAEQLARQHAAAQGRPFISPYNDIDVMAGQGTLGIELTEQLADIDAVFIATGCGGLTGGTGTALKALSPRTRVVAVWPEHSQALKQCLEAGRIIEVDEQPTLSEATSGNVEPGSVTFPVCQRVIDECVTVSEAEIAHALRRIAETERWMVEGAAGVALAGLMQRAEAWRGKRVVVLMCGRNIPLSTFIEAVARG